VSNFLLLNFRRNEFLQSPNEALRISKSLTPQGLFARLFDRNGNCNVVKNQIALDTFHFIQHINRGATVLQV